MRFIPLETGAFHSSGYYVLYFHTRYCLQLRSIKHHQSTLKFSMSYSVFFCLLVVVVCIMEVFNDVREIIMTPTLGVMFLLCLFRGAAEKRIEKFAEKIIFSLV